MCAFTGQPPETQSRLRRVWGSQEGQKNAQHTCQAPYSFDHLTANPGDLSTLLTSADVNIALFNFLPFPANMATDLL